MVAHLTVDLVEALGVDTLVHGHFGGAARDLTLRLSGTRKVAAGERLPLRVDAAQLHLFDRDSGARI